MSYFTEKDIENIIRHTTVNIIRTLVFPRFWYEANSWFKWVNSYEELLQMFEVVRLHSIHMTSQRILDQSKNKIVEGWQDYTEYGLRSEHRGDKTLREFLKEHGYEFD